MPQETVEQIIDKIKKSNAILLLLHPNPNGDSVSAALALKSFLEKLEKEVVLICPGQVNNRFAFLPGFEEIKQGLSLTKSFVIDLSLKKTEVEELSYKKENDKLSIFIKPKRGQFTQSDVSFRNSNFPFELILCVGISALDQLGDFYAQNTELFFETPVVNLDHKASNENFGQINWVNLSSTSTSEIVFDLIEKFESSLIDEHIATQLLAGIISETNSFQHIRTTPAAFLKASRLVSFGGRQQEIVTQLYKNKSIGLLKLWGRVLARLKQDPGINLAYSMINRADVEKSQASPEDVNAIIKEMSSQLGFAKTFVLFVEQEQSTVCFAQSLTPINLASLYAQFRPEFMGPAIKFEASAPLNEVENSVLGTLKQEMAKFNA